MAATFVRKLVTELEEENPSLSKQEIEDKFWSHSDMVQMMKEYTKFCATQKELNRLSAMYKKSEDIIKESFKHFHPSQDGSCVNCGYNLKQGQEVSFEIYRGPPVTQFNSKLIRIEAPDLFKRASVGKRAGNINIKTETAPSLNVMIGNNNDELILYKGEFITQNCKKRKVIPHGNDPVSVPSDALSCKIMKKTIKHEDLDYTIPNDVVSEEIQDDGPNEDE
ncbi:hypothetical protein TetV_581 [Tetraselmis virus 1]|uniref:Uncharacterized protein n=1 Tax=Tetraselmis virus 1 TaxID=2060617 RepID=A0A2P0VP32_9VIRU|nr:hypothetical protein QJ968_gp473 [Tetraselmis virus 1]AUF82663.1 hypothetical protein TetV_581 [Tetraselmis virus 1]